MPYDDDPARLAERVEAGHAEEKGITRSAAKREKEREKLKRKLESARPGGSAKADGKGADSHPRKVKGLFVTNREAVEICF
eukprot:10548135-Lingulodinium_polyedra.AAC.1